MTSGKPSTKRTARTQAAAAPRVVAGTVEAGVEGESETRRARLAEVARADQEHIRQLLAPPRLIFDRSGVRLYHGDSSLLDLAPESIDSVVTDPPSGIAFMGCDWDKDKGGRDQWIAWLRDLMGVAMRALKPGGHALVWALPRTSHWTATALDDAGFEIRDVHHHVFATGFPKSLDIGKAVDGAAGIGTALKPAIEHWILARKPLVGTHRENWLAHRTGGLNIDACRIGTEDRPVMVRTETVVEATSMAGRSTGATPSGERTTIGRWPAHLSLEHAETCVAIGEVDDERTVRVGAKLGEDSRALEFGMGRQATTTTTTTTYRCVLGCPVRALDEQSGVRVSGSMAAGTPRGVHAVFGKSPRSAATDVNIAASAGGASRFFFVAKEARADKDAGLDHLVVLSGGEATGRADGSAGVANPRAGAGRTGGARNTHATVKSVALMRWLVRLVTPPGGVVLDLFAGSGTTGRAAIEEGCQFVGCELTDAHIPILVGRIEHALNPHVPRRTRVEQPELFAKVPL